MKGGWTFLSAGSDFQEAVKKSLVRLFFESRVELDIW